MVTNRPTGGPHAPRRTRLASLLTVIAFAAATLTGCFNTYKFAPDEFRKISRPDGDIPRTVVSVEKEEVVVDRDTAIYARSMGGRRYPLTPFNFKLTRSQLVASDRDTLLAMSEVESYEVDHLNTPITVILISAGVLVAAGLIAFTLVTAEDDPNQ